VDFLIQSKRKNDSLCRNCRVRKTHEYFQNTPLCYTCLKEAELAIYETK
tara:strand:- start:94 stop:240 length:147 start_codon:yes stop_codon:yes gene_type:complete